MLTIGTQHSGTRWTRWQGVLRRGTTVLATCGHLHSNRDQDSRRNGISAYSCIRSIVTAAVHPDAADRLRVRLLEGRLLVASRSYGRTLTAEERSIQQDGARRDVGALLDTIRPLLGDEPVTGTAGAVVLTPRPAPTGVCPVCGADVEATVWSPDSGWREWRAPRRSLWEVPSRCRGDVLHHQGPVS